MTKIAAYVADTKQNLTRTLRWVGGGGRGSNTCNKGPNKIELRKYSPLPASPILPLPLRGPYENRRAELPLTVGQELLLVFPAHDRILLRRVILFRAVKV